MKLNRLTISGFLRLASSDINLSVAPVHLFCGPNEAGKSTIAEAVRFALLGDSPRVKLKKNYAWLLHRGAKKGAVELETSVITMRRDVASGACTTKHDLTKPQQMAATIAFGAQSFVDLSADDRKAFLFGLSNITISPGDVAERMASTYEVSAELIKRYQPLLKASIDAAGKQAEADAASMRQRWERLTGEKYGSSKAETWTPAIDQQPSAAAGDAEAIAGEIDALNAEIERLTQGLGAVRANEQRRAELNAELSKVRELRGSEPALRERMARLSQISIEAKSAASTSQELIEKAEAAAGAMSCPSCDAVLRVADGELEFAPPDAMNFASDPQSIAKLRADMQMEKRRADEATAQISQIEAALDRCANASNRELELQAAIEKVANDADQDAITKQRAAAQATLAEKSALLSRIRAAQNAQGEAAEKTKAALEIHRKIGQIADAVTALGEDGIKADLLRSVLEPINQRMLASAHLAGWLAPQINDDFDIVREDGYAYELLSESAQWRLSAIVADAVSSMSGLGVLILDRMDVLDPASRVQCLEWASKLGEDGYDTVLLMATLKQAPKPSLPNIKVHWLGDEA